MRYSRLSLLGGVFAIAVCFGLAQWAHAVVVFHEDFSARPFPTNMIGKSPNVVDSPGTNPFLLSPGLPGIGLPGPGIHTLTYTDTYDLNHPDPENSPNYGLKFRSEASNTPFQTMFWPVHFDDFGSNANGKYNWGTDKVKVTITARQIEFWNGFAFGFADTDYNLSNMVRLVYDPGGNPTNAHRVRIFLNHGSVEGDNQFYSRQYERVYNSQAGLYTHEFATLSLEYDPNKVIGGAQYQSGVSPYKFMYDPTDNGIDDGFEIALGGGNWHNNNDGIPNGPVPTNLYPMSNSGPSGPPWGFSGIAFGFWGASPSMDFSVVVKELKLETFAAEQPGNDPGDFNGDGVVDIKDYIVWRAGNGPETDYADWTETYGTIYGSGSGAGAGSAVPEPASIAMLLLGLVAAGSVRRSARR